MRYTIKAIENLVTFRNHHLSPGVGSFEEFNEDQMVFSGNEREIANGVYEGGGRGCHWGGEGDFFMSTAVTLATDPHWVRSRVLLGFHWDLIIGIFVTGLKHVKTGIEWLFLINNCRRLQL